MCAQSLSHDGPYCNPKDCSPPASSVCGISQARILDWVAISFSRGSSQRRDQTCISCIGRWVLYCGTTKKIQLYHIFHSIILRFELKNTNHHLFLINGFNYFRNSFYYCLMITVYNHAVIV